MDLDAFFAAVEQRDNPELRGKPVLVGGSVKRGVVAASSYEARKYGIYSAMPMAEAMRRCPHAIVVSHSMGNYAEASRQFFAILDDFSPHVEPLSLDEAFVDVTGAERLLGDGPTIAREIKKRVKAELELVASVGVAPTKFVAKIASDIEKPDGLCVVTRERLLEFLHPLPLSRLWGVGKVTQDKLHKLNLHTIGDVAGYPEQVLLSRLGAGLGNHLATLARGEDPRRVESHRAAVSVGHEQTFDHDITDKSDLRPLLLQQSDRVAARLRRSEKRARTVTLKLKFADFRAITRQRSITNGTSDANVIGEAVLELLDQVPVDNHHGKLRRVRLCGVSASNLEARDAPQQLTLDQERIDRGERLGDTLDAIADKFGDAAILRAITKGKS